MRVYRYWARARCDADGTPRVDGDVIGIGWSEHSQADAVLLALQRAQHIANLLRRNEYPPSGWDYYPTRTIREPIVDELRIGEDRPAVMTRNVYGAIVLNAAHAMFVDLDRPPPPRVGLLGRLLGRKPPLEIDEIPRRVADVVSRHAGMGLRLYETAGGYRGLVTSEPYDPESQRSQDLLEAFMADTLYVTMCKAQGCYRARVTPKPYRIGLANPPRAFPWRDAEQVAVFQRWSAEYDRATAGISVCRFVEHVGDPAVHPAVEPVLRLHDELTCTGSDVLA